jgi:hypothetical protein
MKHQKGFATILAIIIAVVVLGGLVYVASTKNVHAPVAPQAEPTTSSQTVNHDARFTAILNRLLPGTYTISYLFPDQYDKQTITIYYAPGHLRTRVVYDSLSADFGNERQTFVNPTQFIQCALLPDGWLCYRDPNTFAPGGGDWITYFVPNSLPRGLGYGPSRYDPHRLAQIEIKFVDQEKIAGRDAECFDFRILVLGPRPSSKTCFDTESGLMMKANPYNNNGELLPGNAATALSFDPIPASIFELPQGAKLETEITPKVKALFFSNHD